MAYGPSGQNGVHCSVATKSAGVGAMRNLFKYGDGVQGSDAGIKLPSMWRRGHRQRDALDAAWDNKGEGAQPAEGHIMPHSKIVSTVCVRTRA